MPDTGYKSPNSFENMAGFVNDPANAYASDNTYAVFDPNSNESVDYFGFDFSSIPAGSQIDGIEISIEAVWAIRQGNLRLHLAITAEARTHRPRRILVILGGPIRP
jgi:hypothetical protein